jgi:hypothetical protein
MIRVALLAVSLAAPAAYEPLPDARACDASFVAASGVSEKVGETNDGLAFLLRRPEPDLRQLAAAVDQANRLVEDGERALAILVRSCGEGALEWADGLAGALGAVADSLASVRAANPTALDRRLAAGAGPQAVPARRRP